MTGLLNPYNPLQPVLDPARFVGREEVFAFFRQHFVGTAHDRALVVIGRRGLGKSSLLRQLRLDEQYVPCVISLGALEVTDEATLIDALADDIRRALEHAGASTYRLPTWPEEDASLREWFKSEYLGVALAALRMRHLVLMLDDAHLLLEAMDRGALPADVMRYLGDLLVAYDRLDLVVALDSAFENRSLSIDLLNDPTLHIRLAELLPEEAERLVREPVEDTLRYEDGVVEQILDWAGGHPFLLHSVCRLLYRRSEERNHNGPITDNDLDAIRDAVLEQADEIFGPLWVRAKPNERIALRAVAATAGAAIGFEDLYNRLMEEGHTLNKTQLAAAMRSLDYEGLVHAEEDRYTLPADLIGAWVFANVEPRRELEDAAVETAHPAASRLTPLVGLAAVILIVAILGAAALAGGFDSDGDDGSDPANAGSPTSTLSLNLEATRQADIITQTARARPTVTPTDTLTPTATDTPTYTPTETPTLSPAPTEQPTTTATPRATRTPAITPTDTPTPMPSRTPRPSPVPTLDPGG